MNILFISPNYPAGHRRYVAALRKAGHDVLGMGDAGDETFPADLRGSLTSYYRVGDLHDYDSVRRACCFYIWKYGRIDRIESLNPYWRDLVAALRAEFCRTAADPVPEHAALVRGDAALSGLTPRLCTASPKKACALAAQYGYPLLAVPVGNKRLGSRLLAADAGVRSLLRAGTRDEYCFAVCPPGERMTVDGLMLNGALVACAAHEWAQDGQSLSLIPIAGLEERCAELASGAGLTDGFFHCEAVKLAAVLPGVGKKGAAVFISFEPVPPHEYVIDLMDAEFCCDLRESWAVGCVVMRRSSPCAGWSESADGAAVGADISDEEPLSEEIPALPLERKYLAAAAMRSFSRSYRNMHERILRRLTVRLCSHSRTAEPDRAIFGDYIYIFVADSTAELKRGVKLIIEDHPSPKPEKPENAVKKTQTCEGKTGNAKDV